MKKLNLIIALLLFAIISHAQTMNPALITVNGESEISVVPDEVFFNFSITNRESNLEKAKAKNDETVRKILAFCKQQGIADKDIKTDYVQLNTYDDYVDNAKNQVYEARQSISVLLRNISSYDKFSTGLISTGVTQLGNIEFRSTKIKSLEDQARLEAIRNAKVKAESMVKELGQTIGKAYFISDIVSDQPNFPMYKMNAMSDGRGGESIGPTLALGELKINGKVTVSFELK